MSEYAALESELDDVVMNAAKADNEDDVSKRHQLSHPFILCRQILIQYGYGANTPGTARKRLKQSIGIARKVQI